MESDFHFPTGALPAPTHCIHSDLGSEEGNTGQRPHVAAVAYSACYSHTVSQWFMGLPGPNTEIGRPHPGTGIVHEQYAARSAQDPVQKPHGRPTRPKRRASHHLGVPTQNSPREPCLMLPADHQPSPIRVQQRGEAGQGVPFLANLRCAQGPGQGPHTSIPPASDEAPAPAWQS